MTRYNAEIKGYEVWDPGSNKAVKSYTDPIPPEWNSASTKEFDVPSGGTDQANFDIVLGVESVNLGSFKTPFRARSQGVRAEDWSPLDLLRSEGSAGIDPLALSMRRFHADEGLLASARSVRSSYTKGRVTDGVIGSADVWNSELDRIARFHEQFGTSVEEMETASAAQVAASFQIPFLGIRVLSNNITNGEAYDRAASGACQDFVREVARAYFTRAKR